MSDDDHVRRLPPLKALRVLEAIHLTGSVTGAAQRLRVSHSAISHQVRVLTDWSAVPLFLRRGRTTILTEAGQSLAETANRAFDTLRHEIARLPLREVAPVSIAALPLMATEIILPQLADFTAREPGIRLHLSLALSDRPATPMPDLHIQFVRRSAVLASDIELLRGDAIPACSPALVARTGLTPEALLAQGPHIHDEDMRMWPAWSEQHGTTASAGMNNAAGRILLEGSMLSHSAVLQGFGVGFVRRALVAQRLEAGQLILCSDRAIDADWVYVLRIAAERANDPEVAQVASWLREISSAR